MKLILMGTGPFAVPTMNSLIETDHEVMALFTRPIQDSGKRRKSAENPMRDRAAELELPIFDPPSINAPEVVQQLRELSADLFVVCDYGQILSRECLGTARLGGINLHGSLLPKYRGAAPINWAVYNGESTLGITIIHMTPKLDGGPMMVKADLDLGEFETAEEVEPRLSALGVQPVHQAIEMLETWDGETALGELQKKSEVTKAPRLNKSDGRLDWQRTARQLFNQIRAFQPWPRSFTVVQISAKKELRLIVNRARATATLDDLAEQIPEHLADAFADAKTNSQATGCIAWVDKSRLVVQTSDGLLCLEKVQPSGKNEMAVADFLRGYQLKIGQAM